MENKKILIASDLHGDAECTAMLLSRLEKDPQKLQAVYDTGVADGRNTLDALRKYLSAESPFGGTHAF